MCYNGAEGAVLRNFDNILHKIDVYNAIQDKKYRRLSVQVWAQTAIYKSTDTIQIKMGALVNQSHAKKLFGARLVDKNYAKSYSELGNIFQYDSNENGCTSNFKFC